MPVNVQMNTVHARRGAQKKPETAWMAEDETKPEKPAPPTEDADNGEEDEVYEPPSTYSFRSAGITFLMAGGIVTLTLWMLNNLEYKKVNMVGQFTVKLASTGSPTYEKVTSDSVTTVALTQEHIQTMAERAFAVTARLPTNNRIRSTIVVVGDGDADPNTTWYRLDYIAIRVDENRKLKLETLLADPASFETAFMANYGLQSTAYGVSGSSITGVDATTSISYELLDTPKLGDIGCALTPDACTTTTTEAPSR